MQTDILFPWKVITICYHMSADMKMQACWTETPAESGRKYKHWMLGVKEKYKSGNTADAWS